MGQTQHSTPGLSGGQNSLARMVRNKSVQAKDSQIPWTDSRIQVISGLTPG